MEFSFRFKLMSAATAFVLIFSMAAPITVFANEPTPEEPVPTETSAPAEGEPTEGEPAPDETPVEVDVAEVVEALADIGAVLVDAQGEVIPLTAPEAVSALKVPDPIGCPPGVVPNTAVWGGTGVLGVDCTISYASIQDAINDPMVLAGWTIYIDPGEYNENVTINKQVTLRGVGDGTDPATSTIIRANSGAVVTISTSNVKLQNLMIDGQNAANYAIHITSNVSNVEMDGITATGAVNGLRVGTGISVQGLTVDNSHFDGNSNSGWYIAKESVNASVFDGITVTNTSFNDNSIKGIYVEKLSNAVFENIEVINSGHNSGYGFNNGIDINLKWSAYSNITIRDSLVQDSGLVGSASNWLNAAAIAIKARDQGAYAGTPASLSNVLLDNVTVIGGQNGIRFGEPHGVNPLQAAIPGLVVINSSITGQPGYALVNETAGDVQATDNWWGDNSGPSGGVADPSTGTIANGSGGTILGAGVYFDPWTTVTTPGPGTGTGSGSGAGTDGGTVLLLPVGGGLFIPVTGGQTLSLNLDQPSIQALLGLIASGNFPLAAEGGAYDFTCVLKSVTTLTPDQYIVQGDKTVTSVGQCSYWVNGVERTITLALTYLGQGGSYDPGDVLLVGLNEAEFGAFANSGNPFDANNFMLASSLELKGKTFTTELESAEMRQALEDAASVTVPLEEQDGEYNLACVLEGVTELDEAITLEDGLAVTTLGVCSYLVGGAKHSLLVALTLDGESGSYSPGQVLALGLAGDSVASFVGTGNPEDLNGVLQPASIDTDGSVD